MKTFRVFSEEPLRALRPAGWIRRWLELQRHGLTGHLDVAGYPFDTKLWACPAIPFRHGAPWWPYEQTAYWVDGFTRCGLLLDDPDLIAKARAQFDYVMAHADSSGYLGPKSCKEPIVAGRWSHMIFFRAMIAWYYATGDKRIVGALRRHYVGHAFDHSGHRDVCNIEIMCWVAMHSGDKRLVTLAEKTWEKYQLTGEDDDCSLKSAELAAKRPAQSHGVTFCETLKQPALLYMVTGRKRYLEDAINALRKIDKYHMLPSGAPSSTESLRGITALDAHETCDIADYTWSAGYLLMATGEASYADNIERAVFNALPGAVTKDFTGLQYFSSPNQTVLCRNSNHTLAATGGKWMCYSPKPGTECCTGEVNRVMPNYAARMWMKRGDDPAATLYGPSEYSFACGTNNVIITEETNYPFSEEIDFSIDTSAAARFTLWLRIPAWCRGARVSVNGKARTGAFKAGTFVPVRGVWRRGDRIRLHLPMKLSLRHWPQGGVTIERGPLVFALPIPEKRSVNTQDKNQSPEFPSLEMRPSGRWNYALALDSRPLESQIRVEYGPFSLEPFANAPIRLIVPARAVRGWTVMRKKRMPSVGGKLVDAARNKWQMYTYTAKGDFLVTPPLPEPQTLKGKLSSKVECITLVPHGCTLLRVGIFPAA